VSFTSRLKPSTTFSACFAGVKTPSRLRSKWASVSTRATLARAREAERRHDDAHHVAEGGESRRRGCMGEAKPEPQEDREGDEPAPEPERVDDVEPGPRRATPTRARTLRKRPVENDREEKPTSERNSAAGGERREVPRPATGG